MSFLINKNDLFFICGDFNIDISKQDKITNQFNSLIQSYNCRFLINDFTRITNKTKSCIDNIITNYENVNCCKVVNTGFSDHLAQIATLESNVKENNPQKVFRHITHTKIKLLNNALQSETWLTMHDKNNLNEQFNEFTYILLKYFNNHFPLETAKSRKQKKIITISRNNCL